MLFGIISTSSGVSVVIVGRLNIMGKKPSSLHVVEHECHATECSLSPPPPEDTTRYITLHYTCHGEGILRCRVKILVTPKNSVVLEKQTFPELRTEVIGVGGGVLRKIIEPKMEVKRNWRLRDFGWET